MGLQVSSPCSGSWCGPPCKLPSQNKACPLPVSTCKAEKKTPLRVNHLAFGVCGIYGSLQQTSLNTLHTTLQLLGTQKRMDSTAFKDDLMAYSRCILILCAVPQPPAIFRKACSLSMHLHDAQVLWTLIRPMPQCCSDRQQVYNTYIASAAALSNNNIVP